MLNVQALTQTLSAMPLNQLQQYAQLHRNDPYVVTMALSIANQKKQAMTAQQGQAGQQPQPKVVDSEIAQMAPQQMPEDQGIGQLPAGNMNFADGGIVGYADGGAVERYAGGGELLRTTTGGKSWFLDVPSTMRDPSVPYYREIPSPFVGLADKQFATKEEALAAYNQLASPATPAPAPKVTPTYSPDDISGMDRRLMSGSQQPSIQSITPPTAAVPAPSAQRMPAALPTAAPRAAPPAAGGLGDLSTMYADILKKQKYTDPAEDKLKSLEAKELAAAEENKAALLRDQSKFDDAYSSREKRLSDRETDLGKQKDTNTGLAFLNAGLAIMSTPGGLAAAVGKGARVGTEQFAAGLDKIRSAKERLDEARDKMEDLKLNRAEMSAKEIRAAEKDIRNVGIAAEQRGIEGIRMAAGVTEKRAEKMLESTVQVGINRERIASAENIAGMQERGQNIRANAQIAATLTSPERQMWDQALAKHKGDTAAAFKELQAAKAEKFNPYQSYAEYLKAFAGKDTLAAPKDFASYASQFSVPTVKTPPAGAAVLRQPN